MFFFWFNRASWTELGGGVQFKTCVSVTLHATEHDMSHSNLLARYPRLNNDSEIYTFMDVLELRMNPSCVVSRSQQSIGGKYDALETTVCG